jgi:membrane protein DedA with SNARE-associated domain
MNSVTGPVVEWAANLIASWGWPGVFFLMVLESACIPIPSEAIMPFAGFAASQGKMSLWGAIAAGVAGNLVGSWIAYAVGLYGGRPFVEHWGKYVLLSTHKLDVAERWFGKYGAPAVFFSRMLPIVRTFISLPAGAARMNFWKFTAYTVLGCIPWVIMLAYVGVALGDNWRHIQDYLHYVDYVVLLIIAAGIAWMVIGWWRRRRQRGIALVGDGDAEIDDVVGSGSGDAEESKGDQQ